MWNFRYRLKRGINLVTCTDCLELSSRSRPEPLILTSTFSLFLWYGFREVPSGRSKQIWGVKFFSRKVSQETFPPMADVLEIRYNLTQRNFVYSRCLHWEVPQPAFEENSKHMYYFLQIKSLEGVMLTRFWNFFDEPLETMVGLSPGFGDRRPLDMVRHRTILGPASRPSLAVHS